MLLYDSRVSGNCYKVRQLFAHLGIEYERREVDVIDRSGPRELLGALNPALRVPTLVFDDGRSMGESDAIMFYFAEGTPYLPDDRFERAQVLQWLFFEQYSHEPNIAVARFWAIAGITPLRSRAEAKRRGGTAALEAMERHLADAASSSSPIATRSPTSRCTPTPTSPPKAGSSSMPIPRSTRGSSASPPSPATS